MKYIIFVLALLTGQVASAAQCAPMPNMPEDIANQITVLCNKATERQNTEAVVTTATQWSEAAQGFAKAIGIAAREIGVSVNEFVASPAGYLTIAVLAWKTVGGSIAKYFLVAVIWFTVARILRAVWTTGYSEHEYRNIFNQLKTKAVRQYCTWSQCSDSQAAVSAILLAGSIGLSAIVLVNVK